MSVGSSQSHFDELSNNNTQFLPTDVENLVVAKNGIIFALLRIKFPNRWMTSLWIGSDFGVPLACIKLLDETEDEMEKVINNIPQLLIVSPDCQTVISTKPFTIVDVTTFFNLITGRSQIPSANSNVEYLKWRSVGQRMCDRFKTAREIRHGIIEKTYRTGAYQSHPLQSHGYSLPLTLEDIVEEEASRQVGILTHFKTSGWTDLLDMPLADLENVFGTDRDDQSIYLERFTDSVVPHSIQPLIVSPAQQGQKLIKGEAVYTMSVEVPECLLGREFDLVSFIPPRLFCVRHGDNTSDLLELHVAPNLSKTTNTMMLQLLDVFSYQPTPGPNTLLYLYTSSGSQLFLSLNCCSSICRLLPRGSSVSDVLRMTTSKRLPLLTGYLGYLNGIPRNQLGIYDIFCGFESRELGRIEKGLSQICCARCFEWTRDHEIWAFRLARFVFLSLFMSVDDFRGSGVISEKRSEEYDLKDTNGKNGSTLKKALEFGIHELPTRESLEIEIMEMNSIVEKFDQFDSDSKSRAFVSRVLHLLIKYIARLLSEYCRKGFKGDSTLSVSRLSVMKSQTLSDELDSPRHVEVCYIHGLQSALQRLLCQPPLSLDAVILHETASHQVEQKSFSEAILIGPSDEPSINVTLIQQLLFNGRISTLLSKLRSISDIPGNFMINLNHSHPPMFSVDLYHARSLGARLSFKSLFVQRPDGHSQALRLVRYLGCAELNFLRFIFLHTTQRYLRRNLAAGLFSVDQVFESQHLAILRLLESRLSSPCFGTSFNSGWTAVLLGNSPIPAQEASFWAGGREECELWPVGGMRSLYAGWIFEHTDSLNVKRDMNSKYVESEDDDDKDIDSRIWSEWLTKSGESSISLF